jgi:hypothetical protein
MYNALVMPHFNYCSTVWQNNNQTHLYGQIVYASETSSKNNNKF